VNCFHFGFGLIVKECYVKIHNLYQIKNPAGSDGVQPKANQNEKHLQCKYKEFNLNKNP